ncbi:hypothetical protein NDU88_011553 [Pleurodeles waltl]|uniref:Uncharacterized protein n=1 Tax=Pleurodeles waltl TaxID=8319 RepID=A0AAV7Q123_PLEWA|nr:hypothetical protein NDU88_011553 [Pleurodeles waltl]
MMEQPLGGAQVPQLEPTQSIDKSRLRTPTPLLPAGELQGTITAFKTEMIQLRQDFVKLLADLEEAIPPLDIRVDHLVVSAVEGADQGDELGVQMDELEKPRQWLADKFEDGEN